jgi:hypothetical protein
MYLEPQPHLLTYSELNPKHLQDYLDLQLMQVSYPNSQPQQQDSAVTHHPPSASPPHLILLYSVLQTPQVLLLAVYLAQLLPALNQAAYSAVLNPLSLEVYSVVKILIKGVNSVGLNKHQAFSEITKLPQAVYLVQNSLGLASELGLVDKATQSLHKVCSDQLQDKEEQLRTHYLLVNLNISKMLEIV